MIIICLPSNEQSRVLPVKFDVTNVQGSMRVEDDISQEYRIVKDCKQKEITRACISDWIGVILELEVSGRRGDAK